MDYAGLDYRNIRYAVNRPLTGEERANHFAQRTKTGGESNDYLSVIKLNSSYLELVDRWYPVKGFNVSLGAMLGSISLWMTLFFGWAMLFDLGDLDPDEWWVPWVGWGLLIPMGILFVVGAIWMIRSEAFRWTHYPMRLNRNTRQVHVFRQDGTVLNTPWDKLYIVLANATMPPLGKTYDLRAHVLADDGETVKESFTLGYVYMGNQDSIRKLWAFIRRYMEEPDGVEQSYRSLDNAFCLPLDGRKEGWAWSIGRTFMTAIRLPLVQLIFCIPYAWIALGRCVAMSTSKQPRWPDEIEAANPVAPDDPYQKSWRTNPALTKFQIYWPALCFTVGVVAMAWIIVGLFQTA